MYSHPITKEQYNYLLPIYGICSNNKKLHYCNYPQFGKYGDKYYFIGDSYEFREAMSRCKYMN